MQIQAIYRNGQIELLEPLHLKRNNVRVIVTIPDDALQDDGAPVQHVDLSVYNLSPDVIKEAERMRKHLDAILDAPYPPDEELPELTPKHHQRIHQAKRLRYRYRCERMVARR